jgi:DNA-binding NarL/FixJ family response regulator
MTARRVLLVDDHAGFRATARRLLESEGWTVVGEAADGTSALASAARLQPDLVLLDIGLPDRDGFAVAEGLAEAAEAGTPDIVLVSSRDRAAYADRISSSPAVGYIAKGDLDGETLRALLVAGGVGR